MPRQVHYPLTAKGGAMSLAGTASSLRGDDMTWDDIARLREIWKGPLLVKGVHLPEDAARAVKEGLDGIVISNHGGRNLDTAVAPIDVLPEIAAEVGGKTTILLDSGVRRGGDILKALALGANGVLSGRCTLYGTSVAGEAGARHALSILKKEFDTAMAYTGCCRISDIGPRAVWTGPAGLASSER
jgi:isopentenyl diphosphate isomerase/L-lactate dehydrogenase-like FMN-dependent dehydrogenase